MLVAELRSEFPVAETWAYLNHATHGPLSRRTVAAIDQVARAWTVPPTMDGAAREAARGEAPVRHDRRLEERHARRPRAGRCRGSIRVHAWPLRVVSALGR